MTDFSEYFQVDRQELLAWNKGLVCTMKHVNGSKRVYVVNQEKCKEAYERMKVGLTIILTSCGTIPVSFAHLDNNKLVEE
jgi:hypothetical protein